jgi:putative SOS response-associated peptidase YedK
MCNLYSMTKPREAVLRLFRVIANRTPPIPRLPAIFPGHSAPVVRLAADGEREIVMMSWGFVLPQQGKAARRVTNVRDDTIARSGFWRESFEERRCLVPATSFCEPDSHRPAGWHWFALRGDDPRPLFAFPGIWRRFVGPLKTGGEPVTIDTYAFMTTLPNGLVGAINHERMPVLLTEEAEFARWLSGPTGSAMGLARSFAPELMREVKAGTEKEDAG